jgi:CubicO group peptidase (beta-lactamase class C family)
MEKHFRLAPASVLLTVLLAWGLSAPTNPGCPASSSGFSGAAQETIESRIRRVESSLVPAGANPENSPATLPDRMVHYKVPGVSIAVINGGRIEWAKAYGVSEAGKTVPVTPRTLFQAASISKPVGAMGALRLVQEGVLQLDEDVNQKLILWTIPESEFTHSNKVTLRRILSHSAGLTVHGFPGYADGARIPSLIEVLNGIRPANTSPIRVDIEPGTKWRYSGGGFCVMQQLITDVTGKQFPQFMRDTVLSRLGMLDSTYEQPLPANLRERAATGHRKEGTIVEGKWHIYPEMAAAGLWTTPSDLARFVIELQQARAGNSHKVLSPDMATEMLTPQFDRSGLGIVIEGSGPSAFFRHGGSNEGFCCALIGTLETGQGVVVMTSSDTGNELIPEIIRSIAREYQWPESMMLR